MDFKFKILVLITGCFSLVSCAQSKKEITPESYIVYKTSEEVSIDGEATESSWDKVEWTHSFIDIEGVKKPKYNTQVKMMWDDENLYILAQMEEPHVWADITERDAVIFYNNDFEVFIDPDGDTHNYYELEINALNTVWDLFITKPYRELKNPVLNDWNYTGLKSAVSIDGTLNDANDIDKGWTLEIAIPFKDLRTAYKQNNIPNEKFWRVNFSRVNWQHDIKDEKYSRKKDKDGNFLHEYNWVWSPQGVINMHEPEKWGYVYFSSKKVGDIDSFSISEDEKIKWELYKLYRFQRAHFLKHKSYVTSIDSITTSVIKVEDKILTPVLENHSTGYNLTIVSPFSNKTLVVKEDGKFISK